MKILFISFFVPYPPVAGHLQRNYNLIREISRDNEIYLVTFNQKVLLPTKKQVDDGIKELKKYCEYVRIFDMPCQMSPLKWYAYLFFNLFSATPLTAWKFYSKELIEEIKKLIVSHDFDLVHIDTVDIARYSELTGDIPTALNHQNVESILTRRRAANVKNPLTKFYIFLQSYKLRRYEKLYLGKFDVNLCVSQIDIENFKKMVPDARYEIVANGTDIQYFSPGDDNDVSQRLIFAGGMSWYPNADAMEYCAGEIFPIVKREFPDAFMDIIGSHPPAGLKSYSQKDSHIIVHGFVDDIRAYMARAAVYVAPIRVGGGTRLKILDALACGKAVVSTSIGCEGLDVTPEENILIGDTPEEFAGQVIRLLRDSDLRKKLQRNGRKLVENKYAWEIIGAQLNRIYRSIL